MFLITLVEKDGYPVLRITYEGESKDYWLREDQVKLLTRQLANWLTR